MKGLAFVFVLVLFSQSAFSQIFSEEKIKNLENFDKKILTWGFFLGLNQYDYQFNYKQDLEEILVETSAGFNVGLISDLRINNYLNLRFEPGLFITQRNIQYDESYFLGQETNPSDLIREVRSTYVHFPLLLKVSTKRLNNFKPFVLGGISTSLNLSSNENSPDDNRAGEFRSKRNVLFYELGFGVDFYLEWFKFTPSIRGIFGLTDEIVPDADPNSPWTGNIDSMRTRGIFLNFTFQ
ncbi:MAG: porin family protein [Bacteroidota bacterium]